MKNSYAKEKAEELGGYRLDQELSNDNQQVYFNPEAKSGEKLLFTVTGTHNTQDIITDISLGFGGLKNTNRYKEADQTLQQAKQKYNTNQAIVAGHSLGGTIASYIANSQEDKIFTLDKGATIAQPVRSGEQAFRTQGDIISILNAKSTNMQTLPNPNAKSNWAFDPWKAHAVNNIVDTPIALIPTQSLEIQTSTPASIPFLGKRERLQKDFKPYKLVKEDDVNENQLIVSTVAPLQPELGKRNRDMFSKSNQTFRPNKSLRATAFDRSAFFEPALTVSSKLQLQPGTNAIASRSNIYPAPARRQPQKIPVTILTRAARRDVEVQPDPIFKWNHATQTIELTKKAKRLGTLLAADIEREYKKRNREFEELMVPNFDYKKPRNL